MTKSFTSISATSFLNCIKENRPAKIQPGTYISHRVIKQYESVTLDEFSRWVNQHFEADPEDSGTELTRIYKINKWR